MSLGGVEQEVDALRGKEQIGLQMSRYGALRIGGAEIGRGAVPEVAAGAQQPHVGAPRRSFGGAVSGPVVG